MVVEGLLLSLILAFLRKGKLSNLANIKIKLLPLIFISFFIEFGLVFGYGKEIEFVIEYSMLFHFLSYILLLSALMANFNNKWFSVISIGVILNFLVIFLNGGKMPVSQQSLNMAGLQSELQLLVDNNVATHQLLIDNIKLWYLGDVIPLVPPYPLPKVISIGDIIMSLGVCGLFQQVMVNKKKVINTNDNELDQDIVPDYLSDGANADLLNSEISDNDFQNNLEILNVFSQEAVEQKIDKEIEEEIIKKWRFEKDNNNLEINQEEVELFEDYMHKIRTWKESNIEEIINENTDANGQSAKKQENNEVLKDTDKIEEEENQTIDFSDTSLEMDIDGEIMHNKEENTKEKVIDEVIEEGKKLEVKEVEDVEEVVEVVDTENQFIIVDGRIVNNPNYNRKVNSFNNNDLNRDTIYISKNGELHPKYDEDISNDFNSLENFEEVELVQHKFHSFNDNNSDFSSLNITSNENSDQKEDKSNEKDNYREGYELVKMNIKGKDVSFWKKDL